MARQIHASLTAWRETEGKMDELLPMPDIKITDYFHQKLCFEYVGMVMIVEKLKALSEQFPKLAGITLALVAAEAETAHQRTRMLTKNITVAMKHGFDPEGQALSMEVRKDAVYLRAIESKDDPE